MRYKFFFIVLFLIIICSTISFGQPGGGGPGDRDIPFTGLEYLILALGGALGVTKLLKSKRKS